ncbi:MAG: hypothetical protein JWP01_454 [Myxococcales bacterium]|nr:hypothetical protein [Myxococcales bacterium]
MGRFEPTGRIDVPGLEHSVANLPWGTLRGAFGPSDGSAGARSNVPSALAVLRHAPLYAGLPDEIDEAFTVLEHHPLRDRLLYPVAVTVAPFLFDLVRRSSPLSSRITELIAEYTAAADTLDHHMRDRLVQLVADHATEIMKWIGVHDRAVAALAVHVAALRAPYVEALAPATDLSPFALLALLELDTAPGISVQLATELLDDTDAHAVARAAAAAFLTRFGDQTPSLRARIAAALPPSAPAGLASFVGMLWIPRIGRSPTVAECVGAQMPERSRAVAFRSWQRDLTMHRS